MAYSRLNWRNGEVALSDTNLNHMDQGIADAHEAVEQISEQLSTAGSPLLLALHPVGDLLFNTSGINPSTYIGGTWVQWGKGRVPVGVDTEDSNFDTVDKEGGSADAIVPTHSHTFTGHALGVHSHTFRGNALGGHNHVPASTSKGFVHTDSSAEFTRHSRKQGSGTAIEYLVASTHPLGVSGSTNNVSAGTPSGTVVGNSAGTPSGTISTVGEAIEGKNLQPYITCYMWKRTA